MTIPTLCCAPQGQAAARQACEARARAAAARLQQRPAHPPPTSIADRVRGWKTTGVVALGSAGLDTVPDAVFEVGTAARVLSMPHNRLDSLPEAVDRLPHLQRLLISHNMLTKMPWAALSGLSVLDLGHNKYDCSQPFKGNGAQMCVPMCAAYPRLQKLPDAVGQLSNLTHLCVDHNQLHALPPALGTLRTLCVLRVRGNALSSLPPELAGCAALVDLDVAHNALQTLPIELGVLTSLQRLCIDANRCVVAAQLVVRSAQWCMAQGECHPSRGAAWLQCVERPAVPRQPADDGAAAGDAWI